MTPTGPRDFPGTYAEYLARCGDDHLDADAVVLKAQAPTRAERRPTAAPATSAARGRSRSGGATGIAAAAGQARDKVLAAIEAAEARKKEIHALYADPTLLSADAASGDRRLVKESEELDVEIEKLVGEWEAIEAEISANGSVR